MSGNKIRILLNLVLFSLLATTVHGQDDTVCAVVRFQIQQDVTLERQGFEGILQINNDLPGDLEDFYVEIEIMDAEKKPVSFTADPNSEEENLRFFYRNQSGDTFPAVVDAESDRTFRFLFIPSASAATEGDEGTVYYISATIRYSSDGIQEIIEIQPDHISVFPLPDFRIDYFLPYNVIGDNPFTDTIESPVPFVMGVRVSNQGEGVARSVAIDSGQIEIVDNQDGLPVDFELIESFVGNHITNPSLLLDFGDIPRNQSVVGRWTMEASLSGRMTSFKAAISHSDELGGEITSLIKQENVFTYRLVGDVLITDSTADSVLDFLAYLPSQPESLMLFNSENSDIYTVEDISELCSLMAVETYVYRMQVSDAVSINSFIYIKRPISTSSAMDVSLVTREDGKILENANVWISQEKLSADQWGYFLNIFDSGNSSGFGYVLTFGLSATQVYPPKIRFLQDILLDLNNASSLSIPIVVEDPDTMYPTISLGRAPSGATLTDNGDGTALFTWDLNGVTAGSYSVLIEASDGNLTDSESFNVQLTYSLNIETWKARYFSNPEDEDVAGNSADPDGDNISNLVEYALNLDPLKSDLKGLPYVEMREIGGEDYLTFTFLRRINDPDLSYDVRVSSDPYLADELWTSVPIEQYQVEVTSDDSMPGMEKVTVRDMLTASEAGSRRFMKLEVSINE